MAKARVGTGLMAMLLLGAGATSAWAAPTVAQMLTFRPKQEGIVCSTPSATEQADCKVELVKGAARGSGWLLRDPAGKPVRRFFDTNGDNKIDVWSYYLNGVEVYREIDTNFNDKADQYRWLNTGGMKWGVDVNEDGKIDGWKIISPEEVSQEILQAVATRNFARLQALMISEAEMKALELPAAEIARIRDLQKQASAKFQATVAQLPTLGSQARWLHLETQAPQCLPTDVTGAKQDVYKHTRGAILCEAGGKAEWLQTGEMIQVGLAWRIIDAPVPGQPLEGVPAAAAADSGSDTRPVDPAMQPLLNKLEELDKGQPSVNGRGPNPAVVQYNLQRAGVLEQIAAKAKAEDRDSWVRQIADCYDAAVQSSPVGDRSAMDRLSRLASDTVRRAPGSSLAAYITYREIRSDFAVKQAAPNQSNEKVQAEMLTRLAKFVQDYPKAEDAPEVLLQLGMMSEMDEKKVGEAKKWYEQLAKNFPDHPSAANARGAIKRLESDGKVLELTGPVLGSGAPFDISQFKGKVVVVYYWASWNEMCASDFGKLKMLLNTYGSKGLELVCINLDNKAEEASAFLRSTPAPGTQLFKDGGLASPLARDYGVMALPMMFLVGKDGKVVSNRIQINALDDEVKKLLN